MGTPVQASGVLPWFGEDRWGQGFGYSHRLYSISDPGPGMP
jgi:hypothetical protein